MSSQDQTPIAASTNGKNDTPMSSTLVHSEKLFSSSSASSNVKSSRQNKPSTLQKSQTSSKSGNDKEVDVTESDADNISTASNGSDTIRVEDLEIIKTIGTGTFARVCLCRLRNPSGNNNNNNGKAMGEAGTAHQQQQTPRTSKYFALKILTMHDVIRLKQVEHVKNEKNILMDIKHPFIIDLVWHAKDNKTFLYMIFPYICGGELFSYLRSAGRFNAPTSLFYTCEIVSALEYLHSLSIVYRDLKPENLLLDREGHLKITDFGFAKRITDRTWTLCGTPEYLAPEIIQSKGHNKAVDWWALGILIFEMLAGYPPFFDDNPFGIYEKILSGKIDWPRQIEPVAKDLIKKLLVQDRTKRLGNMKNGSDDVKRHRLFKGIDWEEVYQRKLKPPILPNVGHEGDSRNYDDYPESDWRKVPPVTDREQRLFDDF